MDPAYYIIHDFLHSQSLSPFQVIEWLTVTNSCTAHKTRHRNPTVFPHPNHVVLPCSFTAVGNCWRQSSLNILHSYILHCLHSLMEQYLRGPSEHVAGYSRNNEIKRLFQISIFQHNSLSCTVTDWCCLLLYSRPRAVQNCSKLKLCR